MYITTYWRVSEPYFIFRLITISKLHIFYKLVLLAYGLVSKLNLLESGCTWCSVLLCASSTRLRVWISCLNFRTKTAVSTKVHYAKRVARSVLQKSFQRFQHIVYVLPFCRSRWSFLQSRYSFFMCTVLRVSLKCNKVKYQFSRNFNILGLYGLPCCYRILKVLSFAIFAIVKMW